MTSARTATKVVNGWRSLPLILMLFSSTEHGDGDVKKHHPKNETFNGSENPFIAHLANGLKYCINTHKNNNSTV